MKERKRLELSWDTFLKTLCWKEIAENIFINISCFISVDKMKEDNSVENKFV